MGRVCLRDVTAAGVPLGGIDIDTGSGQDDGLSGLLDTRAGHGTFIAGLVRQGCPSATIMPIPVMDADGMVAESTLLNALTLLLTRHVTGQLTEDESLVIDVLSLSLGYYHETSADDALGTQMQALMSDFANAGVLVVAAAGNDATTEPLLPAGFSANPSARENGLVRRGGAQPVGWFRGIILQRWRLGHRLPPGCIGCKHRPCELPGRTTGACRDRSFHASARHDRHG